MAQRVLVFEKDTNFVRELQDGFAESGVEVEVVRDPDLAIQRTRLGDVSLILLSVDAMETSGEAFLVCKRFKSDDDLAKVPFVIMGGAQHAESFESHKKLKKRRADEYLELPASFAALFQVVAPLLGLSSNSGVSSAPEVNVVDDDIDVFADNAFGELQIDESVLEIDASGGAMNTVPSPSSPSPAALDTAELEGLRARAEEAERRLEDAEQRVRHALGEAEGAQSRAHEAQRRVEESEERAKGIEARLVETTARAETAEQRANKAPAPTGQPGVSSRDYLDLREQLNRKDKELLSLRDEITQRDRQLLDGSDRSLQLERAQAELHDNLTATQRQLEDAQTKIRAYEVDREAVTKRLEDFRGRLARAEEKGKRVEDELDALKTDSAREIYDLKLNHEQAMTSRAQASAAELERLRGVHLAEQSALSARSQKDLADLQLTREHEVETLKGAHERALRDMRNANAAELEAGKQAALASISEAVDKAEAEQARALDALALEHTQDSERRAAEADRAKAAAVAGVERELEAKYAAERKELEDRHAAAELSLQKKLTEAESLASVLSDRITEIEQAKQELDGRLSGRIGTLEGELSARTQERDTAHNELSAMRASIASLERTGAQLSDRLSALEADLGRANDRIDQQSAKIALDKELLDRVRRALGIGIGLLEQQKHNVV